MSIPEEVVTRSRVRDVALPGGAGTMALVTLDNGRDHHRPNSFGPQGLAELDAVLARLGERAQAGEIVAVGVTGKPFILAAGADLTQVGAVRERAQAEQIGRAGHATFRRLGELAVPSFAFVNGLALGGGLEIALHCTYRTVSSGAAGIALPECFLGLVPGWGGTYLLPRLVGPEVALEVMIGNALNQNKMLTGPQAFGRHIADTMFEPADFLEQSLAWAGQVLAGAVTVEREDHTANMILWDGAVATARMMLDHRLHGAAPAPYRALELVRLARTADRDTAFEAETQALADLLMGQELRASLYAFDLVQRRARKPAGAPDAALARRVTKVGVVGAGLMAAQLATLFVRRLQVPVVMTDLDAERVARGVGAVHAELDGLQAKSRLTADAANRLRALVTGSTDQSVFADCDVVIEAVFEELSVKQTVLGQLEAVVGPECVLMTNTSSLSVTAMAADLTHPERVVGFHFFNPVAVLPLVEVVRGERTDDATLATAFAVGKALRKSCVLVKDAPAFVVNRLLTRLMGEVMAAVDEGTPIPVADRALDPLGMPMAPLVLLGLVGPPIALHVAQTLHQAFPDRFGVSGNLQRIVDAGITSVWTKDAKKRPVVDERVTALLEQDNAPQTEQQVLERATAAVAQEAALMLAEGVVAAPPDLDLCMILGAGWPFHLGGITPYLDRSGVSEKVNGARFLPEGVATLPEP